MLTWHESRSLPPVLSEAQIMSSETGQPRSVYAAWQNALVVTFNVTYCRMFGQHGPPVSKTKLTEL